MKKINLFLTLFIFIASIFSTGCATKAGTYALAGAGAGATAGAGVCDHNDRPECMIGGAIIGGIAGFFMGRQADKTDQQLYKNQQVITNIQFEQFKNGYNKIVSFAKGSSVLTEIALQTLKQVASELAKQPDEFIIVITGVSDGKTNTDLGLAAKRALAVRNELLRLEVTQFISVEAITEPGGVTKAAIITLQ